MVIWVKIMGAGTEGGSQMRERRCKSWAFVINRSWGCRRLQSQEEL